MSETAREGQLTGGTFQAKDNKELLHSIERADMTPREISLGETEIVIQRHGVYEKEDKETRGKLTPEAVAEEAQEAEKFLRQQIEMIPEDERSSIDLLFIASDTRLDYGQRSLETGNIVLDVAKKLAQEYGLEPGQILNNSERIHGGDEVRPTKILREPRMFEESPEFVDFLKKKYGETTESGDVILGKDFWIAFEEDAEKQVREEMGAEGPDDLADRLMRSIAILRRFARLHHRKNPDRRLLIWATSHYDLISPYVRRELYGAGREGFLGVDYGSGVTVKVDKDGRSDTIINDKKYEIK